MQSKMRLKIKRIHKRNVKIPKTQKGAAFAIIEFIAEERLV